MSDIIELAAEPRAKAGKGSARAARREGRVPAVIYGANKDPEMVTIAGNELQRLLNKGGFFTHRFEIKFGDKAERVLARDMQFHPVTDDPMHVDFLRATRSTTVAVEVPVHFVDEDKCPGLKDGGVLNVVRHTVEIECPAGAIPEQLNVSLDGAEMGETLKISGVKLPEGAKPTITDRDFTIATIAAPSSVRSAEDEEAEEAEDAVEDAESADEDEDGGDSED